MKQLVVLLLLPGWDASPLKGYLQRLLVDTVILSDREGQWGRIFLSKENTRQCRGQPSLLPPTLERKARRANHYATWPTAGMAQWWEHSPPTNVAWIRFPDPALHVGWVCCWFSSSLRGCFSETSSFSALLKNQHFQIPIRSAIRGSQVCQFNYCWVSPSLTKSIYLFFIYN